MSHSSIVPVDSAKAVLVGRVSMGEQDCVPHVVVFRDGNLVDLSDLAPTMSDLCDLEDPAGAVRATQGKTLCSLEAAIAEGRMLAPCDLQAIKASGVTFAESAIERIIEERAEGDVLVSSRLRADLTVSIGQGLGSIKPGSDAAERAKTKFKEMGLWSQYLEVAIGPNPEIFTKAQPLSAVGYGANIGVRPDSHWNNPEAEIVVAVSSRGNIVGAALGNDVNLRDFEGRSALLLGTAKDNTASCAIGPFIRLLDRDFSVEQLRSASVSVRISGPDGYHGGSTNDLSSISRSIEELVSAAIGPHHQYPDGMMLFLGAMHVPLEDRGEKGSGFFHREGDRVLIHSPELGTLENEVIATDRAAPWTFGVRKLMRSLVQRGLI